MPLVEIDLLAGRPSEQLDAIADAVHAAMVAELGVPERDRFQLIREHEPGTLRFDRGYLDVDRSEGFLMVRVTLAAGRSEEVKSAFYARLAGLLAERAGLRGEDLAVVLSENTRADWSFGRGQASYLVLPPETWR